MKQDLNKSLISRFFRNCSIGCSADIWHYFTPLEPSILTNGKFKALPPYKYISKSPIKIYNLKIPMYDKSRNQLFTNLLSIKEPITIELLANKSGIHLQVVVRNRDENALRQALFTAFPESEYNLTKDYFKEAIPKFSQTSKDYIFDSLIYVPEAPTLTFQESKLNNEFWSFLINNVLSDLEDEETVLTQFSIIPCKNDWRTLAVENIRAAKEIIKNNWLPVDVKNIAVNVSSVQERKVLEKYYAVKLRHAFIIKEKNKYLKSKLKQGFSLLGKSFKTVDRKYFRQHNILNKTIRTAITNRLFFFPGFPIQETQLINMLPFNVPEIIGFSSRIIKDSNGQLLGTARLGSKRIEVIRPNYLYPRGCYCIGENGTGKTSLMEAMVLQDIQAGKGVCLIEPHGDFSKRLLQLIPKERIEDVVYFNPSDPDYAFQFNILELGLPKHETCNAIMDTFKSIFSEWSYRQYDITLHSLLALKDTHGTYLNHVSKLLLDQDYRKRITFSIKDDSIRDWFRNFQRFGKDAPNPITYKINMFSTMPLISQVINQPVNSLNIFQIMEQGKILIANLPKGSLGIDTSRLLGTLITSLINIGALKRERIPLEERKEFGLYIDEFHNFITPSMVTMLAEARKFKVGLHLAHQTFTDSNLPREIKGAIMGNTLTKIIFKCGFKDEQFLASALGLKSHEITGLKKYEAIARIGDRIEKIRTIPPPEVKQDYSKEIIRMNREKYYYKREKPAVNEEFNIDYDEI